MINAKLKKKIAKYMLKKRKARLMTRGNVVETTGLNINTVKNIENGKHTGGINLTTLKLLCECYKTTLAKLFKKLKM